MTRKSGSGTILFASQVLVVTVIGKEYFWTGKGFANRLIELKRDH